VCTIEPRKLQDQRCKTEVASVVFPPATLQEICHSVARYYQQCNGAGGGHFKRALVKVTSGTMSEHLSNLLFKKWMNKVCINFGTLCIYLLNDAYILYYI
jgi:hypothetical protein